MSANVCANTWSDHSDVAPSPSNVSPYLTRNMSLPILLSIQICPSCNTFRANIFKSLTLHHNILFIMLQLQPYMLTLHIQPTAWYPYSYATNHLTHTASSADTVLFNGSGKVRVGNGPYLEISGISNSVTHTPNRFLMLNNIIYAPNITKSLIYVS